LTLRATYDVDPTVDLDVDLSSSSSTARRRGSFQSMRACIGAWSCLPTDLRSQGARSRVVSTSNVAVEVKALVKANVEDKVDVAGSALSRFVLSGDTSSVA
jgi:hypothetical protein